MLEYEINIATTRLKVDEKNRKGGYMITYNPGTGWIKEQYIGLSVTNEEWIKDENWKAEVLDENIQAIAENAQQQANLAATNAALAEEKANEAATQAAYAKEQGDRLSNIDLSLYRVVLELPSIAEMTEDDMNKIYLMVSAKQGETNKYDEYICVDGEWELLGQYEAAIDLTAYVGKDELKTEIATLDKLDEISKFVCIDKNGESAGVMTKEQVASVLAELIGTATLKNDGLMSKSGFLSAIGLNLEGDANTVNNGVYKFDSQQDNMPVNYGILVAFSCDGWIRMQLCAGGDNGLAYIRMHYNSWTSWKQL